MSVPIAMLSHTGIPTLFVSPCSLVFSCHHRLRLPKPLIAIHYASRTRPGSNSACLGPVPCPPLWPLSPHQPAPSFFEGFFAARSTGRKLFAWRKKPSTWLTQSSTISQGRKPGRWRIWKWKLLRRTEWRRNAWPTRSCGAGNLSTQSVCLASRP